MGSGLVEVLAFLSPLLALCVVLYWSMRQQTHDLAVKDRMQKSLDESILAIVALKNPYAAQAHAAASTARTAEHVGRAVADAVRRNDLPEEEEVLG